MYVTPKSARTYDQIQIEAKLTVCKRCKRAWFMTHKRTVCQACRRSPRAIPAPQERRP